MEVKECWDELLAIARLKQNDDEGGTKTDGIESERCTVCLSVLLIETEAERCFSLLSSSEGDAF